MKYKNIIVKVQVSLASSDGVRYVMIYDKDENFCIQKEPDKTILKMMNGEDKKFFYANVSTFSAVNLLREAEWQDW